ncbi:DUF3747 domain-containing protein [Altericista sp. CCNU0014]|uniref:DUF3747 domain-containing protein n=1 Tax=Altericista sp. CCNU0014 TaxID=3082949 RepID=UPI00384EA44B
MMSQSGLRVWSLCAGAIALWLWSSGRPSQAVTFSQVEVDQSKFVAVAVPRASGYYTLLVLEQRSNKKPCWRESSSSPTRIDPLLLNFNFTGICGRSTDSNGYSIRAAGRDLGMSYQLSLQKQKNDLLLLGVPSRSGKGKGKVIELGRTHGIRSGFLKIKLKDGWRFAKRTYGGKTLGHIYFSRDTAPAARVASRPEQKPSKTPKQPSTSPKQVVYKPAPPSAPASDVSGRHSYLVMVLAPTPTQQAKVRAHQPGAFRTSHRGQSVMQVGIFSNRTKAESLKTALTRQGFKVLMVTKTARALSSQSDAIAARQELTPVEGSASELTRIAVPKQKLPIGYIRGARGVYTSGYRFPKRSKLPPPPPSSELRTEIPQ